MRRTHHDHPLRHLALLLLRSPVALGACCTSGAAGSARSARPPGLRPVPEQLAFTCVTPGCDTSETVQVDVVGQRRVAIKRILLEGDAADDFELAPTEQPPFIVGANSNFIIEVRYAPKGAPAPGSVAILVTYTDASPEESDDRLEAGELVIPLVRRLVGEPVLDRRALVALSFGVVTPGESAQLPLAVKNEGFGNVALELSEVTALARGGDGPAAGGRRAGARAGVGAAGHLRPHHRALPRRPNCTSARRRTTCRR